MAVLNIWWARRVEAGLQEERQILRQSEQFKLAILKPRGVEAGGRESLRHLLEGELNDGHFGMVFRQERAQPMIVLPIELPGGYDHVKGKTVP